MVGWDLPAGWELDAAIRYAYSEGLRRLVRPLEPVGGAAAAGDRPLAGARGVVRLRHAVTQGLVADTNRGFFSPGTHYLLIENLEVGLRVGWGITADAAPFFSDAGFGWRW